MADDIRSWWVWRVGLLHGSVCVDAPDRDAAITVATVAMGLVYDKAGALPFAASARRINNIVGGGGSCTSPWVCYGSPECRRNPPCGQQRKLDL